MIINRQENKRVDHIPALALLAGVMVVIGSKIGYTTRAIEAGALDSIVVDGLCDVPKAETAPDVYEEFAEGQNVYYDESESTFTGTASGNILVGYAPEASGTDTATARIVFNPPTRAEGADSSPSGE